MADYDYDYYFGYNGYPGYGPEANAHAQFLLDPKLSAQDVQARLRSECPRRRPAAATAHDRSRCHGPLNAVRCAAAVAAAPATEADPFTQCVAGQGGDRA